MEENLPEAIASAELDILGVKLRCHVLDNGQRVIDEESVLKFFELLAGDTILTPEDLAHLARWLQGG